MIENRMNLAEAMQMSLLDAQKKNIEADTKLKEADANKTSGVDTTAFLILILISYILSSLLILLSISCILRRLV